MNLDSVELYGSLTILGNEIQVERTSRVEVAERRIVIGLAVENVRHVSVEQVALQTVHILKDTQKGGE